MRRAMIGATTLACASALLTGQLVSSPRCTSTRLAKELSKVPQEWHSISYQNANGVTTTRETLRMPFFSPIVQLAVRGRHLSIGTYGSDYFPAKIVKNDHDGIVFKGVIYGVAPLDAHDEGADKVRKYADHQWMYTILAPKDCDSIKHLTI